MGSPFPPFQHLLCCLPPSSASLLPAGYARLLTEKESPLASYFPAEFCSDLNGKKKEYEAVILLPFLEEERIIDAIGDFSLQRFAFRGREKTEYLFKGTALLLEVGG